MKRRYAIFIIAVLLAGCAADRAQPGVPVLTDNSPQRGPVNAPVTIIEFLDYT